MADEKATTRGILEAGLRAGPARLRFDGRKPGVMLPGAEPSFAAVLTLAQDDQPIFDDAGLTVRARASDEGDLQTVRIPWAAIWAIESRAQGGQGFFAEACPPEEVARFFAIGMQQAAHIHQLEAVLRQAVRIVDNGAARSAWMLWRPIAARFVEAGAIVGR